MSPEEMERVLASAQTRRLSPEGERRILSAVASAAPTSPARWWVRRVPLWQAAAACVLLSASTFGLSRTISERPVENARRASREDGGASAGLVSLDQPIFGTSPPPTYRLDISKWRFQSSQTE